MEPEEMSNPIAEVPAGATVLVKGKKVTGSICKSGELHTGWQLAGIHPCACKKAKAATKKKAKAAAPKKATAKKKKGAK